MNKSNIVELLKNHSICKARSIFLEKEIRIKVQANEINNGFNKESVRMFESELNTLRHKIETVETCLKMVGEYNERYKIIIETHYINNVRIEDVADTTHMSRSRCYELCNEAIAYMSRIIFGEEQKQDIIQVDINRT